MDKNNNNNKHPDLSQSILFHVPQNKESNKGLEQHEVFIWDEQWDKQACFSAEALFSPCNYCTGSCCIRPTRITGLYLFTITPKLN